jgi:hypothetical protein
MKPHDYNLGIVTDKHHLELRPSELKTYNQTELTKKENVTAHTNA